MSLDGLRAWIGEVERKLGMRTRVFLVLVAIAIGGAGAGIYLAIEADDGGGSEDLQALEEKVEAASGAGSNVTSLQTQINQLHSEVESLRSEAAAQGGAEEPVETAKPPKKSPEEAEAKK
jgi:TolA-binding protein